MGQLQGPRQSVARGLWDRAVLCKAGSTQADIYRSATMSAVMQRFLHAEVLSRAPCSPTAASKMIGDMLDKVRLGRRRTLGHTHACWRRQVPLPPEPRLPAPLQNPTIGHDDAASLSAARDALVAPLSSSGHLVGAGDGAPAAAPAAATPRAPAAAAPAAAENNQDQQRKKEKVEPQQPLPEAPLAEQQAGTASKGAEEAVEDAAAVAEVSKNKRKKHGIAREGGEGAEQAAGDASTEKKKTKKKNQT